MSTRKRKIYKTTILFIILDLLAITGFVVMYGPWDKVRNMYVNTALKPCTINTLPISSIVKNN